MTKSQKETIKTLLKEILQHIISKEYELAAMKTGLAIAFLEEI